MAAKRLRQGVKETLNIMLWETKNNNLAKEPTKQQKKKTKQTISLRLPAGSKKSKSSYDDERYAPGRKEDPQLYVVGTEPYVQALAFVCVFV